MPETLATMPAPGCDAFRLKVSRHAAERFVDRVRPGLLLDDGAREMARLAVSGSLQRQAPDWLRTHQRPAFYLVLTPDIAVPVDVASNGSTYYARTVLTKPVARSRTRQQQRRHARRKRRATRDSHAASVLRRSGRQRRRRAHDHDHRRRWRDMW
jgi:hypothetical protein